MQARRTFHQALCTVPLAIVTAGASPARGQTRLATLASDPPPEVQTELPDARPCGRATMRWFGLHLYDLHLWSARALPTDPALSDAWQQRPLALELRYARDLVGRQIAQRSVEEMRRIGPFDEAQAERWLARLSQIFPDVRSGDRLTGVQRPGAATRFFHNGVARGEVNDVAFAPLFFGIWLSPRSSEPRLRQLLLGMAP